MVNIFAYRFRSLEMFITLWPSQVGHKAIISFSTSLKQRQLETESSSFLSQWWTPLILGLITAIIARLSMATIN